MATPPSTRWSMFRHWRGRPVSRPVAKRVVSWWPTTAARYLFYSSPWDKDTVARLARWLMAQPWCGNVTVGQRVGDIQGTLPASLMGNDGERAPDVTMSFRWRPDANQAGYTGTIYSSGGTPGQGQHGSMGRVGTAQRPVRPRPRFQGWSEGGWSLRQYRPDADHP